MAKTVTVEFRPHEKPPKWVVSPVTIDKDDATVTWVLDAPPGYMFAPADGIKWKSMNRNPIIGNPVRSDDRHWILSVANHGQNRQIFYYSINVLDDHGNGNVFDDDPEVTNDPTGHMRHPLPRPHDK